MEKEINENILKVVINVLESKLIESDYEKTLILMAYRLTTDIHYITELLSTERKERIEADKEFKKMKEKTKHEEFIDAINITELQILVELYKLEMQKIAGKVAEGHISTADALGKLKELKIEAINYCEKLTKDGEDNENSEHPVSTVISPEDVKQ